MAAFDQDKDINTAESLQGEDSEHSDCNEGKAYQLAWQLQEKEVRSVMGGDKDLDVDTSETTLDPLGHANMELFGIQSNERFSPFSSRVLNEDHTERNENQSEAGTVDSNHSNDRNESSTNTSAGNVKYDGNKNKNKVVVTGFGAMNNLHGNHGNGKKGLHKNHRSKDENENERDVKLGSPHGSDGDDRNIPSNNHFSKSEDERIAQQLMEQLRLEQVKADEEYAQKLLEEEKRHSAQTENRGGRNVFRIPRRGHLGPRFVPPTVSYQPEDEDVGSQQEGAYENDLERPPSIFNLRVTPRRGLRQPDREPHCPHHHHGHHHHGHPHRLLHEFPRRPTGEHVSPMEELMRIPMHMAGLGNLGRLGRHHYHHPGMNIVSGDDLHDADDYEALWALGDRIGEVKERGISKHDLSRLPTHVYKKDTTNEMASSSTESKCLICLTVFSEGDNVKTLPCLHMYHSNCIDKWLQKNAVCPICRENVKPNNSGEK